MTYDYDNGYPFKYNTAHCIRECDVLWQALAEWRVLVAHRHGLGSQATTNLWDRHEAVVRKTGVVLRTAGKDEE